MGKYTRKNRKLEKCKNLDIRSLTPDEQLKYEIAEELGLLPDVLSGGWKSLSAKDTGRIGGLVSRRKKEMSHNAADNNSLF